MNIYTVSLFGHRHINNPAHVENRLEKAVSELIQSKEYVQFLIGRNGEFDILAASVVRRVIDELNCKSASLILVMPYMTAEYRNNKEIFQRIYDNVEICPEAAASHYRAAIPIRNRSIVDRSDSVICCITRTNGGAYTAVQYAEKMCKSVLNIAESI